MKNYIKAIGLAVMGLCFGSSFGQTAILTENFSALSTGNSTSTTGSSATFDGNDNFPTVVRAYQAGGSVKLGTGSLTGSITSEELDLSVNGGKITVKFDVKGWTTVEGSIRVSLDGQSQTVTYTAKMADSFQTLTVNFTGGTSTSTVKIETTAKRAFIDNVSVSPTITTWNGSAWSAGAPTATADAIIKGNYNTTTNGTIAVKNLSIESGNITILNNGLNVTGTLLKTGGSIDVSNGGVTFSGTASQTIPAGFFVNNTIKDLTSSNSIQLSLNGAISLKGVLNVTSGTLVTNGNLTLKSSAEGSARIAPVSGTITGQVTVERFIPKGKRAFRFLTPSVSTTNFISNSWQVATHITGSQTATNGFDQTTTGNPSLFTYENSIASGSGWKAVENTNATNLLAGNGYRLLVRGNRSVDLGQSSATEMNNAITLSAKGAILTGDVVFNAASSPAINATENAVTNGFSLIGNPYVSPVDWHAVAKSGMEDVYYTWDPNMGTASQRGRYVAYSQTNGLSNLAESQVNQFIQPGQAFFVKNSVLGTPGTITFSESNKSSEFTQIFRNSNENSRLKISVFETSEVALGAPIDGTVAIFGSNFSNEIGLGDVEKMLSSGEHLALERNNKTLAIEALGEANSDSDLFIKTIQFQGNKTFTFKITATNFSENTEALLIDNYLNSETEINLSQDNFIDFATTSEANSFSSDRFKIVFRGPALGNGDWNKTALKIYPNPIENGQINIALPETINGKIDVNLHNLVGQKIYNSTFEGQKMITLIPDLQMSKGIYIIEIVNGNKSLKQKIAVK